jgi:hypothetical protein
VDLLLALLAYSETALADAAQSGTGIAQLFGFSIDVTDCQSTLGGALDFFYLIRALLNRNAIAVADPALQLRNAYLQNGSKSVQFVVRR